MKCDYSRWAVKSQRKNAKNKDEERNKEIDLALAVMCAIRKPGETTTTRVIAEITGMSHEGPRVIEQRALKKLRKRLGNEIRTLFK